eukprot:1562773-Rhodomonas_salina.1
MSNEHLCPFWLGAEKKEMDGLWNRGCFERVKQSELPKGRRVKSMKVRLVVQGQRMEQGADFEDTFAPVPRTTAARMLMALAAGNSMQLHSLDITQ